MPDTLYMSRLTFKPEASAQTLLEALYRPGEGNFHSDMHKQLVWSVFSDGSERKRDFLWRMEKQGQYYALSHRLPCHGHKLLRIETKIYAPVLQAGQRLNFILRANAVIRKTDSRARHDIVMHALRQQPEDKRANMRMAVAHRESVKWWERQGNQHGFSVLDCQVIGYRQIDIPRRGRPRARFGVLDLQGTIQVECPDSLLSAQASGLGRAKSFGCGLLLLKRVQR